MSGWNDIRAGVAGSRATLLESLKRPDEKQLQRLQQIVERNRNTEFGKRYGLQSVRTIDDYQQRVPLHDYDDFRPDIERMMAGEKNVLVADDVLLFEPTGGSTGGSKFIPFTEASLGAVRRAILPWLDDLVTSRPGIGKGKAYWAISPATRQKTHTSGGIPIGIEDDSAYFGGNLAASIVDTLAVPPTVAAIQSHDEWRSQTLSYLSTCTDLSFISVWSPTFLLQLLDAAPDPMAWQSKWPILDTISCWCSSTSQRYAAELARRFPDARIQEKGLLATEGVVTVPLDAAAGPVLAVDSGFYEFETDSGDVVLPWHLETGKTYRVLITTDAGLYRYRLGDRVRVSAWHEATPCLEFMGRDGGGSDLCGEKLTEAFVAAALSDVPGFAFLVPLTKPHPAYLLVLDEAVVTSDQARASTEVTDSRLMKNPQYRYAREIGQLPPIEARRISDPLSTYKDICMQLGQRLGDIKAPALASAAWSEQFIESSEP